MSAPTKAAAARDARPVTRGRDDVQSSGTCLLLAVD